MRQATIPGSVKLAALLLLCALAPSALAHAVSPGAMRFGARRWPDASGFVGSWIREGVIDTTNPFYMPLGTNGQACDTCPSHRTAGASPPPTPRPASPRRVDWTRFSA